MKPRRAILALACLCALGAAARGANTPAAAPDCDAAREDCAASCPAGVDVSFVCGAASDADAGGAGGSCSCAPIAAGVAGGRQEGATPPVSSGTHAKRAAAALALLAAAAAAAA
jgi:hypothetical protein